MRAGLGSLRQALLRSLPPSPPTTLTVAGREASHRVVSSDAVSRMSLRAVSLRLRDLLKPKLLNFRDEPSHHTSRRLRSYMESNRLSLANQRCPEARRILVHRNVLD